MNKDIGLIGFGRIGQQTAEILKSFGANIYFSDPYVENVENNLGENTLKKIVIFWLSLLH